LGKYGDYLLSLAFAHCVSPDSLAGIADWYRETEMADLLDIPDISYKKLLEALDSVEQSDLLQSRIFERVKTRLALAPKAYFYDITNIYFYGWGFPLARKGHNPDGRRGPQIQVGLAVTQKEGLPITHKVYEGISSTPRPWRTSWSLSLGERRSVWSGIGESPRSSTSGRPARRASTCCAAWP